MERKDICGRVVKAGDLVVVKGDSAGKEMGIGIFTGTNVRCLDDFYGKIVYRNCHDMYLIENPVPVELKRKAEIEAALAERDAKNDATKKGKATQKANVPGTVYKVTKDDEVFLYCGKCIVETTKTIMSRRMVPTREEGHLYLSAGKNFTGFFTEERIRGLTFNDFLTYSQKHLNDDVMLVVLKNPKKYEAVFHTVRFPDEFTIEQDVYRDTKVTQKVRFIK